MPLITIDRLTDIDLLYPYYKEGYFKGLPDGLTPNGFYKLIGAAMTFIRFYTVYYNGELIGVFDCRPIPKEDTYGVRHETHVVWFTDSKRKRALSLQEFTKTHSDLITFVHPEESSGHFAMARRGLINYVGEINNMHVFERAE